MTAEQLYAPYDYWRQLPDGRVVTVLKRGYNSIINVGRFMSMVFDNQW